MTWANCNSIKCNPNKCKELFIKKKGNSTSYTVACNILQRDTLELLSLTFQNDCKFSVHAKAKLRKANKCLHLLTEYAEKSVTARQKLITVSIALSDSDLNVFQQFLADGISYVLCLRS